MPEGIYNDERICNVVQTMSDKQEQSWIKFLIKKCPGKFKYCLIMVLHLYKM